MFKKILLNKKLISIILLVLTLLTSLYTTIFAVSESIIDTSKTATLKIVEYENAYGENKNNLEDVPLSNVEITIYKIDEKDINKTASQLESEILNNTISPESKKLTTGADGIVTFTDLKLGRYLVVATKLPVNVSVKMESFLIDLPRTSDDGSKWDYDVTVYPKNTTVYGNVTLTKYNNDNSITLQGTTWELQTKNANNEWEKYNYEGTLTTDSKGQITINNLPVGDYRFIETSTLDGYILDTSNVKEFKITKDTYSYTLTATNEKLDIQKQVKTSSGYGEAVGANTKDLVEWSITTDIPKIITKMNTYYVTDTIPTELDYVQNSMEVYGINEEGKNKLTLIDDYTITEERKKHKNRIHTSKFKRF